MEKINDILVRTFKIKPEDSVKNLSMDDVDKWDSLSHMDLIVRIEDELNIQISGDDIADMITFDAIRKVVSKYL